MKVRHVLAARRGPVITVAPDAPVREAVGILVSKGIGSLVILTADGAVAGLIAERDILRALASNDRVMDEPVQEVMVRNVIIGMPQDDISAVAQTMLEKRVRHLPIVEDGRLIGIVSIGDVLKTQRDAYRGTVDTLETQIMAEGES